MVGIEVKDIGGRDQSRDEMSSRSNTMNGYRYGIDTLCYVIRLSGNKVYSGTFQDTSFRPHPLPIPSLPHLTPHAVKFVHTLDMFFVSRPHSRDRFSFFHLLPCRCRRYIPSD